jgi:hypothetical protein
MKAKKWDLCNNDKCEAYCNYNKCRPRKKCPNSSLKLKE